MPTPHEPAPDAPRRSGANIGIRDPRRDVAHEGYTVLVTRPDGRFGLDREEGPVDFDARVVSWWELVRPRLPAWLPHATIRNLRVGRATVSIRFERQPDASTAHEVLETAGRLRVIRSEEIPERVPGATGGLEAVWSGDGTSPVGRASRVGVLGAAHG